MIHGPQLAVVLKVGKRALTNGNGSQAGDDHAELAVDRPGKSGTNGASGGTARGRCSPRLTPSHCLMGSGAEVW